MNVTPPFRRMNYTFVNPPSHKRISILTRIFRPAHVTYSSSVFFAYPDLTSNFGKERQLKCTFSTLIQDSSQPQSNQKNLTSKLGRSTARSKQSNRKRQTTENQAVNVKRCGVVMTSMLHKTYWNMKDRKLIDVADYACFTRSFRGSLQTTDLMNLEKTFYPIKKKFSKHLRKYDIASTSKEKERQNNMFSCGTKERFFQQMYIKYQDPNVREAAILAQCYPNPEKIFENVLLPLMEAKGLPLPKPVITNHLKQVYWKACLTQPWTPYSLIATHPDKDTAVQNVFLRACEQLVKLGLMCREKEDKWQPMTCERVILMLETLAKYIESSFIVSKGRGFKIILNQAKDGIPLQHDNQVITKVNESQNFENDITGVHSNKTPFQSCCDNLVKDRSVWKKHENSCSPHNLKNKMHEHKNTNSCEGGDPSIINSSQVTTDSNAYANQSGPKRKVQSFQETTDVPASIEKPKTQWECTVHVGWPFPFTVCAQGISLPGAQMLGFMEVARKLKTQGLLTSCNSGVNPQVLGRLMLLDLQAHWDESLHFSLEHTLQQKFEADAELFCDASFTGFGAYLVLKDIGKVRWLCESWEEHDVTFQDIIYPQKWLFESTLAELYTTVTSVYSWKKKLRGKKLLCFCDNQTVVGLINSYRENPISEKYCINTLDRLVTCLQATCLTYGITIQAVWVERERNTLADLLSRKKSTEFCDTVPQAALKKTKAIKLSIPWSQYLL